MKVNPANSLLRSLLNYHLPSLLSHLALKQITVGMIAPPVDAAFADFEMPSNYVHARDALARHFAAAP